MDGTGYSTLMILRCFMQNHAPNPLWSSNMSCWKIKHFDEFPIHRMPRLRSFGFSQPAIFDLVGGLEHQFYFPIYGE